MFNCFKLKNNLIFNIFSNIILCNYSYNQEIRFSENSNFEIDSCFFSRNNFYNGYGGIIYCFQIISNMTLKNCIFSECSSERGGAIYFICETQGSNVELKKICCYNCYAEYYQFGIFKIFGNSIHSQNIELLSILNDNTQKESLEPFYISNGNINLKYFNTSKSSNRIASGFTIYSATKAEIKFSTIVENYVSDYTCIALYLNYNHYLSYLNVIKNNSPKLGVITNWAGNSVINNSIFYNNTNTLFYVRSSTLFVSNSVVFHISYNISDGVTATVESTNIFFDFEKNYLFNSFKYSFL